MAAPLLKHALCMITAVTFNYNWSDFNSQSWQSYCSKIKVTMLALFSFRSVFSLLVSLSIFLLLILCSHHVSDASKRPHSQLSFS